MLGSDALEDQGAEADVLEPTTDRDGSWWAASYARSHVASDLCQPVVEVDGGYHVERACADARRDAVLARTGNRVLRLDGARVVRDIEEAVARVLGALKR